jgi:N-acetylmuramoyl-L-alanine amidase
MVKLNYQVKHIKKNKYSRPGYKLLDQQAVIEHWTANYGADAEDHWRYFNETVIRIKRYAGAHIFVDRHKALELIPLDEGTFGGNDGGTAGLKLQTLRATDSRYPTINGEGNANLLCIHVEMCVEEDGTIHPDTIARTALVNQYLQRKFPQLKDTKNRFVRHFDVTGKNCPAPMVSNPKLWKELLELTDAKVVIPPSKPAVVESKEENTISHKTNWIRSKVDDLRYYSKPSWKDKDVAGHLPKGYGFPQAVRKVRVDDAWQYEVKNSKGETYYLTASDEFVSVEHMPATSTAQKPMKPKVRCINLHGHMKTWAHYPTNRPPVKVKYAHEIPLKPAKYNGLSYTIIENGDEPDTYIIKTDDFGLRKIWAPRDRDSSITSSPLYN